MTMDNGFGIVWNTFETMLVKEKNLRVNAQDGELCMNCFHKHYPLLECSYPGCDCNFEELKEW